MRKRVSNAVASVLKCQERLFKVLFTSQTDCFTNPLICSKDFASAFMMETAFTRVLFTPY